MNSIPHRQRLLLGLGLFLGWAAAVQALVVREVQVRHRAGHELDVSLVTSHVGTRPGSTFSRAGLSEDVRQLQQSGLFAFVEAVLEPAEDGVVVVYLVEPRLRLRRLTLRGAEAFGYRRLRSKVALDPGDRVDDGVLAARRLVVEEAYRKRSFPEARMSWTIHPSVDGLWADVEVRIEEGRRMRVRRITFEGNEVFSDHRLRRAMHQKRAGWMAWLTGSGKLDADALATDADRLREVYLNAGYLDAVVKGPEIRDRKRGMDAVFSIEEGEPYTIRSLTLDGATLFDEALLLQRVPLTEGQPASLASLREGARTLRDWYGRHGYVDTMVRPEWQGFPEQNKVDVVYSVREGRQAEVRDVRIRGHVRTQDRVIRRELAIEPGDVLDESAVRVSERRLHNLGYFSHVGSRREPAPEPDRYDIVFDVEEQPTGQLMVGAGFSSIDAVVGYIEVGQGNFDLFGWPRLTGAGQKIKVRSQFGTKRNDLEVSFVEPWLFHRRLALGVDFFRHDRRFLSDDYRQRNLGGSVSLTRAFGAFTRGTVRYSIEEIDVYDVSVQASQAIRDWEGKRLKSATSVSAVWDTRDSVFVPTRGVRYAAEVTLAGGPLGGDTDFYRLDLNGSRFWPLWFGHVFNLRGGSAVVQEFGDSEDVPIFDRLFLGGARSLRGFRFRDVGPRDELGEPIGGKTQAWATAEYTVPLFPQFRLAGFYDVGMVWADPYQVDSNVNSSVGIGLRMDIPMFPLRLDYAWPQQTDAFNDRRSGRFSFHLGHGF